MKVDFKKLLLAGTAVVAVSAFAVNPAYAADELSVDADDSGAFDADELATSAFDWATNTNGTGAAAEATNAHNVRVNGTATINGLQDTNTIGDGSGNAIVSALNAQTLTLDDSVNDDAAETITIDGDISKGAVAQLNLTITGENTDATADVFTVDVNGDIDLGTGTLTIDTDTNAGNAVGLNISGDLTAAATVLKDDGAPITVTFDGTSAQTIAGTINGETDADGTLVIANASGATFTGIIGGSQAMNAITISKTGANSAATFKANVSATAIVLGDGAGTGTNTMTVNTTGGNITVAGTVNGTAGDTDVLAITGGANKATFSGVVGGVSALDSLTVATASTGAFDANVSATAITLTGTGIFEKTSDGDTVTGNINGASAGSGVLNIDGNTTWVGGIGNSARLNTVSVAVGKVLTVSAAAADRTIAATTIVLDGAASGLTLTPGANDIVVSNDITTLVNGAGAIIVSDGAGSVTFEDVGTSALKLATLAVAGGSDNIINANGNLYVGATTLDDDDTLNLLGTTGTVSGTIAGVGAGDGNVVVGDGASASNYTFGGAIGGTTIDMFQVKALSTANISANVATTASGAAVVGVDVDGTLNVDTDTGAVTVSTAVGDTDIDGTVSITGANNATITAGSDLLIDGTLTTALDATKTLALTGAAVIGGTSATTVNMGNLITNAGTLTLGANGLTTTLNINKTAGFDPNGTTILTSAGNVTIAAGSTLNVGLGAASLGLEDGDAFTVITSAGGTDLGAALTAGDIVLVDSGFVNLEDDTSDATNLNVIASVNAAEDVVSSSYVGVADALIDFAAATDELAEARGNLLSAPDAESAQNVAESLAPTVDGGAIVGALNVSNRVVGLTSTRLSALRDGNATSGVAAGNVPQGLRGWVQGFGQTAGQDRRDGVDGYDADTYGVAVGADGETVSGGHVGMAVSYGNTDVDSEAGFGGQTDVDSYQISMYGDAPLSDMMYVEGMVGYAYNDIDSSRFNAGGTGLTANGEYDANQFTAYAEIGRDYAQGGGLTLTPSALAHWTYYDADDYTETGAGNANLNVDSESMNVFEVGVGADAAWDIQNANGSSLKPVLSAGVRYDLVGDSVDTTSTFTGGGAAFSTQGMEPGRATLNLGAGVTYYTLDNWELSAEYDFEYKSDYDAHSGQMRAAFHF